jgi:hypothetical protein
MKNFTFLLVAIGFMAISNVVLPQINKIVPADIAQEDAFGWSVDMYENHALVGSVYDDDNDIQSGSAYVFHFDGTQWNEQAKIVASDGGFADYFGYAVCIHDGQLIVGAYRDFVGSVRSGSAYVFTQSGNTWIEAAKLVPFDPEEEDRFGAKVAIYGNYAAVGAYYRDDNGESSGAVYVYKKSAGEWNFHQKLAPESLQANDLFGTSVAFSADYLFIGSIGNSDQENSSGKVFVFELDNEDWILFDELYPEDPAEGKGFGSAISATQQTMAIGAYRDHAVATESGSVYLFEKADGNWEFRQKVFPSDGTAGAFFGHSLAIDNDRLVVGALYDNTLRAETGSAYVYTRESSGNWLLSAKIVPDDAHDQQRFSTGIGLSGKYAIAGAPYDEEYGYHTGAAYICDLDIILHQQEKIYSPDKSFCYPNPATRDLIIMLPSNEKTAALILCDVSGKLLIEKQINGNQTVVDVTSLSPGIYLYRVQYKSGLQEHGKWVKQ